MPTHAHKTILAICASIGINPNEVFGVDIKMRTGDLLEVTVMARPSLTDAQLADLASSLAANTTPDARLVRLVADKDPAGDDNATDQS